MIKVARLGRPQGLDGYLGLYVDESDHAYFEVGNGVLVDERELTVRDLRRGARGPEVAFEEILDRNQAESIRNHDVHVLARRELGENEFWPDDLRGLDVRPHGGTVIDVTFGVGQDRLTIERDGSSFEVPFVAELVPIVDIDAGFVIVEEIDGLN